MTISDPTQLLLPDALHDPTVRITRRPYEYRAQRLRDVPCYTPECAGPEQVEMFERQAMRTASWYNPAVEQWVGLALSTRRRVLGFWLISCGTLDTILEHPREVFRTTILLNAASIVRLR
jgi:DNA repair protein RadC